MAILIQIIKISFLNISRNVRRSLITFFTMAVGFSTLVLVGGFIDYSYEGLREMTIRTQLGHFQIYKKGYKENHHKKPYDYLIHGYSSLSKDLRAIEEIETVTQRLSFSGLVSSGGSSYNALVVGVNSEVELGFSAFETIIDGEQIFDDSSNQAVIGAGLSKSLGISIGDTATILTSTIQGMINAVDVLITGIASTGSSDYDNVFIKIPLKLVQKTLNTHDVSKILLLLNETDHMPQVEEKLKLILSKNVSKESYEYSTWREIANFYNRVVNLYTGFFRFFLITILLIIFFSVYNTVSMSTFERTKEIGTLRAIGFKKTSIMKIFITESFLMGIIGSIIGVALSLSVIWLIDLAGGLYMSPPPGSNTGYYAHINIVTPIFIQTSFLIICVSIISSFIPSFMSVNKTIVKALNYV